MNIQELFEFALTQGCGVNLASFKRSKAYTSLLKKQKTLFLRYSEETDEGKMLRAGHLVSGTLLNFYSENQALIESSTVHSKYGHGIEMRAMIGALGKTMIAAAKKNLPTEARSIAKQWKLATADEQIKLTQKLYHLFQTESQRQKTTMSSKNLFSEFRRKSDMRNGQDGFTSVVPMGYGKWNKIDNPANCQGKSQMIMAFAELVGAEIVLMLPNRTARDVLDDLKSKKGIEIKQDILDRRIEFPDPEFVDSLDAGELMEHMEGMSDSFHLCPIIRVKDGRWVLIDSNSLNWGVLNNEWGMDDIFQKISKYKEVLPGLSISANAPLQSDHGIDQINQKFNQYIARSKKLQDLLQQTTCFTEILEVFVDSGEFDFLWEEASGKKFPPDLDRIFKISTASDMLFGPSDSLLGNFLDDPEHFLQKKKDCLYTYYHCLALDTIDDYWNDNGIIVHPEAHFAMDSYHHIAIAAINSLGIDERVVGMSSFILEYCFCQTTLHNAMISKNSSEEVRVAAKEAIRKLPFKHGLSKRFI